MDEKRGVHVSAARRPGWSLFASSLDKSAIPRIQRDYHSSSSPSSPKINLPFTMPADVSGLTNVLDDIFARPNLPRSVREHLARDIVGSFLSAVSVGRAPDKVTILLLGGTGQGKSKTINVLMGRESFLKTGQNESTTRDIQTVLVPIVRDGIKVTLAFDDTPGLLDTALANRTNNAVALSRYCQSFTPTRNSNNARGLTRILGSIHADHPDITFRQHFRNAAFPNAILLTSTWRDVKKDAHNGPGRYTSALGCSTWTLKTSGLYDEERPNVVVVVTRALSDPRAGLDVEEDGFDAEWEKEAQLKRQIIHAIQDSVYPGSQPWPVVFVENGGNSHEFSVAHTLPNKEKGHQNLMQEMRLLFNQPGKHGVQDLLGLQALAHIESRSLGQLETDVEVVTSVHITEQAGVSEVEVRKALRKCSGSSEIAISPTIDVLASTILGHSYNPVRNQLSKASAISKQTRVIIANSAGDGFDNISKPARSTAEMCPENSQLEVDHDIRTTSATVLPQGQYAAYKTVAKARLDDTLPVLSPEMAKVINALPPWDGKSPIAVNSYYNFFDNHGTHVVVSAAFGGVVYVKCHSATDLDEGAVANALQNGIPPQPTESARAITRQVTGGSTAEGNQGVKFVYKGGRRVGTSLLHGLQQIFDPSVPHSISASNDWRVARSSWVEELMEDPVFLPPSPQTKYVWLHSLAGLSPEQMQNLMQASRMYLRRSRDEDLDRESSVESVRFALRERRHRLSSAVTRVAGRVLMVNLGMGWRANNTSVS